MSRLYAIGKRVIVKEMKQEQPSGLILVSKEETNQVRGYVLHAGSECKEVFERQVVLFNRYSGMRMDFEDEEIILIEEDQILAVILE